MVYVEADCDSRALKLGKYLSLSFRLAEIFKIGDLEVINRVISK